MLPTHEPSRRRKEPGDNGNVNLKGKSAQDVTLALGFTEYLRRFIRIKGMDIEMSCFQMFYLCTDPQKFFRNIKWHKHAKDQWARDDPAFFLMLVYFIFVASLSFAIAFNSESLLNLLRISFS